MLNEEITDEVSKEEWRGKERRKANHLHSCVLLWRLNRIISQSAYTGDKDTAQGQGSLFLPTGHKSLSMPRMRCITLERRDGRKSSRINK